MFPVSWFEDDLTYLRENYHLLGPKRIAEALGRSVTSVKTMGSRLGLKSAFQLGAESVRHDYFAMVSSPTQAYLLGLLATDGCVMDDGRVALSLVAKDRCLIELIRDEVAPLGRISSRTTRTSERAVFCVQSKRLAADLAAYGVTPRKTFTLEWPEHLPAKLEASYICGAFDGDGTLAWNRDSRSRLLFPRWEICSASRAFLEAVADSIRRNTDARVIDPFLPKGRTAWTLRANSANAEIVDRWIHADVPGLARKRIPADAIRPHRRSPRRPADIPPLPGKARGTRNTNAKLTDASVADARVRHAAGERVSDLAREYGVSGTALANAISGKTWRHVGAPIGDAVDS